MRKKIYKIYVLYILLVKTQSLSSINPKERVEMKIVSRFRFALPRE